MQFLIHDLWEVFRDSLLFGTATKPAAGGYYWLLCDDTSPITASTPLATIAAQELVGNGYARVQANLGTVSTASGNALRTLGDAVFGPFTAAVSYRYAVLIANGTSAQGNATGIPVGIVAHPSSVTKASGQSETLRITYTTGG